ncbi:MAG: hypothetical protein P1V20_30420, partial [Verrucomicrobiales bacterium]|nr:hypothetical protein [Verrucomicrobiales bacterium]
MRNFLSILLLPLFSLALPAEEISLQLGPKSPALPLASATPPLHHKIPEAVHPKDGLMFTPEQAFQWAFADTRKEPIQFTIDSDNEIFDHVILTIWNWHNRPLFRKQLPAGQTHQLHLKVDGRGVYQFTLEGYKNEACKKRLVRSAAVTEDLNYARDIWKTDEFFLGICGLPGRYHWSYEGKPTLPDGIYPHTARELEAELMASLGFQLVRIDESMEMGEAPDGYQ